MTNEQRAKAEKFRRLHTDNGTFLAPNAWNAGSARMLEAAGFPALSTTSGGIALSLGLPDYEGRLGREEMMMRIGTSRFWKRRTKSMMHSECQCYAQPHSSTSLTRSAGRVNTSPPDWAVPTS